MLSPVPTRSARLALWRPGPGAPAERLMQLPEPLADPAWSQPAPPPAPASEAPA